MDRKRYMTDGYFTVEAAMIFPFVMGVILLVIYMWFFQYDRCLMEQDYALITVMAAEKQKMKPQERVDYLTGLITDMYTEDYYAWKMNNPSVSFGKGKLRIEIEGSLEFPFKGFNFWSDDNIWESGAVREGTVIDKAFGIRTYRKIRNLIGA